MFVCALSLLMKLGPASASARVRGSHGSPAPLADNRGLDSLFFLPALFPQHWSGGTCACGRGPPSSSSAATQAECGRNRATPDASQTNMLLQRGAASPMRTSLDGPPVLARVDARPPLLAVLHHPPLTPVKAASFTSGKSAQRSTTLQFIAQPGDGEVLHARRGAAWRRALS